MPIKHKGKSPEREPGRSRRATRARHRHADLDRARERMVEVRIARRGIRDSHVLAAMRCVPREDFVSPGFEEFAYEDAPLPIGKGQTISQPYMVALMIKAAEVKPGDHVLEIGTGSGYAAAVMSRIAARVYTIERHPSLGKAAGRRIRALDYENIELRVGDGTIGWPEAAPFDAILVRPADRWFPSRSSGSLRLAAASSFPSARWNASRPC